MLIQDALLLTCGSVCLQVHQVLQKCTKPVSLKIETRREDGHFTWLVKDTHWFTLIKQGKQTLVYSHTNSMLYYASPNVQLTDACPDGHSFLCQVCIDRTPDGQDVPRLLVTDLVTPVIPEPQGRGSVIRSLSHVFTQVCHIQWSGERQCLIGFMPKIPHETSGVIRLGDEAICPTLEAAVSIVSGTQEDEVSVNIPSQNGTISMDITDGNRARTSTALFLMGAFDA
jgi:hypothetical protein